MVSLVNTLCLLQFSGTTSPAKQLKGSVTGQQTGLAECATARKMPDVGGHFTDYRQVLSDVNVDTQAWQVAGELVALAKHRRQPLVQFQILSIALPVDLSTAWIRL